MNTFPNSRLNEGSLYIINTEEIAYTSRLNSNKINGNQNINLVEELISTLSKLVVIILIGFHSNVRSNEFTLYMKKGKCSPPKYNSSSKHLFIAFSLEIFTNYMVLQNSIFTIIVTKKKSVGKMSILLPYEMFFRY